MMPSIVVLVLVAQALNAPIANDSLPTTRLPAVPPSAPPAGTIRLGESQFRTPSSLNRIQLSPKGQWLVGAESDNIWWWNPVTSVTHYRRVYPLKGLSDGRVLDDGELVLLYSVDDDKQETMYHLGRYDPAADRMTKGPSVKVPSDRDTTFSLDGRFFLLNHERQLAAFDVATGAPRWDAKLPEKASLGCSCLADGTTVAVGFNKTILQFELESGRLVRTLKFEGKSPSSAVETVRSSADGRWLAVSHTQAQGVVLWDLAQNQVLRTLPKQEAILGFMPNGEQFVTTDSTAVTVWNTKDGTQVISFEVPTKERLHLHPSGERLYCQVDDCVIVYDMRSGKRFATSAVPPGLPNELTFRPDGSLLAKCTEWGGWVAWSRQNGRWDATPSQVIRPEKIGEATPIGCSPCGTRSVYANETHVRVLDVASGRELAKFKRGSTTATACAATSDGKWATSVAENGLGIIDLNLLTERVVPVQPGNLIAVSANRAWAAIVTVAEGQESLQTIQFVDLQTNRVGPRVGIRGEPKGIQFSGTGRYLAVSFTTRSNSEEVNELLVVESTTGAILLRDRFTGYFRSDVFAISGDGRTLVRFYPEPKHLVVWELISQRPRLTIKLETDTVKALALDEQGRTLAASIAGAPILLWDLFASPTAAPAKLLANDDARKTAWASLRQADATAAFTAARSLMEGGDKTLTFLKATVRAEAGTTQEQLTKWIRDLDAPAFTVRDVAMQRLRNAGRNARAALVREREQTDSTDLRQRIDTLLKASQKLTPSDWQHERTVELVEWIGTPNAYSLLKTWAAGPDGAYLTDAAQRAIARQRTP